MGKTYKETSASELADKHRQLVQATWTLKKGREKDKEQIKQLKDDVESQAVFIKQLQLKNRLLEKKRKQAKEVWKKKERTYQDKLLSFRKRVKELEKNQERKLDLDKMKVSPNDVKVGSKGPDSNHGAETNAIGANEAIMEVISIK